MRFPLRGERARAEPARSLGGWRLFPSVRREHASRARAASVRADLALVAAENVYRDDLSAVDRRIADGDGTARLGFVDDAHPDRLRLFEVGCLGDEQRRAALERHLDAV